MSNCQSFLLFCLCTFNVRLCEIAKAQVVISKDENRHFLEDLFCFSVNSENLLVGLDILGVCLGQLLVSQNPPFFSNKF